MTHEEKIEWYSLLHKQNLNGRETEDELFEAGISVGIQEAENLRDEFTIGFSKYLLSQIYNMTFGENSIEELLKIYKKEKGL